MGKLTWFTAGVIAGLSAAAIGQELARHPKERTWKGKVAGVPYNFHVAEWGEVARGYWNPENDTVISSRGIGLGWGVNFAAVTQKAQGLVENVQHMVQQTGDSAAKSNHHEQITEPVEQ
jgi:hypothetical protein